LQPLLRALQETVDAAIASKEGKRLATQLEAMRIPEYQTWFLATFGPDDGAKLASIYLQTSEKTETRLMDYFVLHAARGGQITASLASGGVEPQKTEFLQQFDDALVQRRLSPGRRERAARFARYARDAASRRGQCDRRKGGQ
jgi:hypothetical protein